MAMTAMTILERCRSAEADKRRLLGRIDRYRDMAGRITATLDSIGGGRSTGESDRMAGVVGEIDALERQIRQREREYGAELAAANKVLDGLPSVAGEIMSRFYIRRQPLRMIASEMGYSYGYVRNTKSSTARELRAMPMAGKMPDWYRKL